jgi:hypothetical protein
MKIIAFLCFFFFFLSPAGAVGPLGPADSLTREVKGIYTSFGGWFEESLHDHRGEYVLAKKSLYTELGWGIPRQAMFYGRLGITSLTIAGALASPGQPGQEDFKDSGYFLALGGAYLTFLTERLTAVFSLKGTYHWQDFEKQVPPAAGGVSSTIKISELWDVTAGAALACLLPGRGKIYLGPSFTYSSFRVTPWPARNDINMATQAAWWTGKERWGIFAGLDYPLPRGFRLNLEGRYSGRFAVGGGVAYVY